MSDGYLKDVYDLDGPGAVRSYYDKWARTYDAEVGENGYATPARCAAALKATGLPLTAPILDMGCGTGLSGVALAAQGFATLDGCDLSPEMLEQARAVGVYRDLFPADAVPPHPYAAIAAVGVIGPGAAPPDLFDTCLALLDPGGRLVFSFNDHALDIPDYPAKLQTARDSGAVRLLFEEHGDHLPGIGIKSTVYVLEKT
ncbi:methyltransferase domain-containing protein [Rhodophyticola sp. CCM32]|uniref:class I SAM-dependent DNA methyltransferase n=1 Tax=Rhodophyticola sp. CCM32 TaxID=2916397 RepID=UPI00107F0EF5|nr:methyltransferase domain-containing protein [Rhodophyticola sp. CCM32]QBY00451.1 methyltransferase domain-containing protein [Rhodophyticola sp. CCM32]